MSSNFQALAAALKIPNQDADGAHTASITIPATSPYTYQLGQGAPLNYPSGWQLVPPTGITGVVTVSGGGYSNWTEVTLGTSLTGGTFSVDYSTSLTGGTCYFSSTDASKVVSITFTAALLVNEAFMASLINAIQAIGTAPGQADGLMGLDATGLAVITTARGVRQAIVCANTTNSPNLLAGSWATVPWSFSPALSITTNGGSKVRVRLTTNGLNSGGAPVASFQATIGGATLGLGQVYIPSNSSSPGAVAGHTFVAETGVLAAGTYPLTLQYENTAGATFGGTIGGLVVEVEEIA